MLAGPIKWWSKSDVKKLFSLFCVRKLCIVEKIKEMKGEFRLVGKLLIISIMRHMHYKHDFFVDIISQNKNIYEIFISINIQVAILYIENMTWESAGDQRVATRYFFNFVKYFWALKIKKDFNFIKIYQKP